MMLKGRLYWSVSLVPLNVKQQSQIVQLGTFKQPETATCNVSHETFFWPSPY